jgi:hypothetical protein
VNPVKINLSRPLIHYVKEVSALAQKSLRSSSSATAREHEEEESGKASSLGFTASDSLCKF